MHGTWDPRQCSRIRITHLHDSAHFTIPLRLRILGNYEILRKSQVWVETYPSAQSPFKKLDFGNSSQNPCKRRYQIFLVLSNFTGFFYFVPNVLSRIVWANKVLVITRPSLLPTLFFWHFVYHQSIYQVLNKNVKQVSCAKLLNFMVLCKQYFAYLI